MNAVWFATKVIAWSIAAVLAVVLFGAAATVILIVGALLKVLAVLVLAFMAVIWPFIRRLLT